MPPRGAGKRAATAAPAAAPAPQRLKLVAADPKYRDIVEALSSAEDATPETLEILTAVLPLSLGVPQGERHELQECAVAIVADVLASLERAAERAVEKEESALRETEVHAEGLQEALLSAEAALAARAGELEAARTALQTAAQAQEAAQAATAAADNRKAEVAAKIRADRAEAEEVEAAFEHVASIRAGTWRTVEEAKQRAQSVGRLLERIPRTDELLAGLRTVAARKPEFRSAAENELLEQLRTDLLKHSGVLRARLAASGPLAGAQAALATDAAKALSVKSAHARQAKEFAATADGVHKVALGAVERTRQALSETAAPLRRAEAARDRVAGRLAALRAGPLASFRALRGEVGEDSAPKDPDVVADGDAVLKDPDLAAKAEGQATSREVPTPARAGPTCTP